MKLYPAAVTEESAEEIATLVRQLHEIQQRLRYLTGGEVDAVTHPDGQSYLLHEAQEQLRTSEEELRKHQTELRVLFDYLPAMIVFKDTGNGILRANKQLAETVGMSVTEIEGKSAHEIFPVEAAKYFADDREVIRSGTPKLGIVETMHDKEGREITIQTDKVPVCDGSGMVTGVVVMSVDITERRLAELAILFNEQRYRNLVEATTAIVWDTPASGEFQMEQPGWSAFTGQSFGEYRGWGWLEAIHPDDRAETARIWSAAVASRSIYQVEHRLRASDHSYRDMVVRAVPILASDGTIVQWTGIHTDVTERKLVEQQLFRAQRMEGIGTLASGIAHDLNNALAPIIMALDLFKMRFPDQASRELIETVGTSARRGADMVGQLLSFARGDEGRRVEVRLTEVLGEVAKIANDTFLKTIRVRSIFPQDLGTVTGDPTQLHQVLLNLCVNARDAMPDGGKLTLSAENIQLDEHSVGLNPEAKVGTYVMLQVEDSGAGMQSELIEKIFDPFFTTKEVGQGTGLGLYTSLGIVKSHGGFLRVRSDPGRGTCFQIYLPARDEVSSDHAEEIAAEIPRGAGELILVVDDEEAVRRLTRLTLEAYGYRVILASEGAEAATIYAASHGEIAAVLTDVMMPVMGGAASIKVMRQINPSVRIVAASGLAEGSPSADACGPGAYLSLPKPYTAASLLKAIRAVLHPAPSHKLPYQHEDRGVQRGQCSGDQQESVMNG
ncbi:PAS domain S-box protein [Luteolibacter arcticus]|uniref:histidine kinase n=1 Tax=Luteolibacter arcticus TaxID=1581411 RepID=A0ABT3GDM4_9BACT|nr:PAS domain-containing sensor histidine kinase [Luteolibacter arcticus]MCW1921716.1 PAS domain S-box protein [Luteolibacter arcticus]